MTAASPFRPLPGRRRRAGGAPKDFRFGGFGLAVILAGGLLATHPARAQNKDGPTLNIPFTGDFGLPAAGPRNELPESPADGRFLPSPVTPRSGGADDIPTLPDFSADHAYADYQRGFYKSAFEGASLRAARNPRDGAAMTLLGEIHANGLGVARDMQRAADWYRRGDAANDRNATFALAMLTLADGTDADAKRKTATTLLEKAAAAGHPLAAYNLALSLLAARQAAELPRTVSLLEQAAAAEVADAQYALAVMLREGQGAAKDSKRAAQWMARAAANGNIPAQVELAIMLFNGDGVEANEERAARLFAVAAARGNAIAQNRLARILAAGRGLPKDLVQAASWHLMAAAQGRADTWLDTALKNLTADERRRAEALAQERTEDINFGLAPE
ncbi:MAG: tetratricopeptide repeat protein [Pseudochelatococcus sp.]|jgi:TPR repeat protein|uniref:tetratricopeptide repeat protein n=1 Tax=Pseudochelatococcus sp. TaxID=2020869 RepID=UPI003D8C8DCE